MKLFVCALCAWLWLSVPGLAGDDQLLLRFPDICGDRVAFVYAGDLWTVAAEGGEARRLTSHAGQELYPKISPDGKWIAFSAEYSGSRQVHVIPAEGGSPRQLTWYNDVGPMPPRGGTDYLVLDWTPDSRKVLVRANRTPWGERMGKYFLVSLDGGLEQPLQIPEGGGGSFSPDGKKICYTPIEREFRTWKRYQGGRAQDVWIYDLELNTSQRLTDFPGTDRHPVWHGDKIFFVSDRDLTLNIHAYDLTRKKVEPITQHTEYDVLWPSGHGNRLVYENGGAIWRLDLDSGKNERLRVGVHFDNPLTQPALRKVADFIGEFDLSPSGKRAVFSARGDLFTVPEKEGVTVNLSRTPAARETQPAWSPDGRQIAYASDATGEYELYVRAADGTGTPRQLTEKSSVWRYPPRWSPDGKKLLYSDKNQWLQFLDVESRQVTRVDRARRYDITDHNWSPDSRWVVYTKDADNGQDAIWLYSLDTGKTRQLTDARFADSAPVFSADGKYLFFLSNRTFTLSFSSFEFNYLYHKATRIYVAPLTADTPPLMPPKNDVEPGVEKTAMKGKETPGKEGAASPLRVRIEPEGFNARVTELPPAAGDLRGLASVAGAILYQRENELHRFTFDDQKDEVVLSDVRDWALSQDGKKLLYRSGKTFGIVEAKAGQKAGEGALDLDNLILRIEPLAEWTQIFHDGWRIFRDWFYVKNLHGVDWEKMRARYGRLVPHLGSRADLDFIFGELVAEVNASHAYVNGGEAPKLERVDGGLLGADLRLDQKAGRYVIAKIYPGENWREETRSPLTETGVAVKEGDYLISIDHRDLTGTDNPYRLLEGLAGKRIAIRVNSSPQPEGAREYWIRPVASELKLFYLDWVESRRRLVDRLSGGRIGYIHVPDTATEGNEELFRGMYAMAGKEALIIDDRYNGGGFIPVVMTELVSRSTLNYWARRGLELAPDPGVAIDGPKAMLINGYSSSGGDAFPYYFRKKNLGTLIGTRTWGGLIGISGNPGFVDGGSFNVPTFGFVDTDGKWAVEGEGVAPDIEVIDRPELIVAGKDPSVEKAVEVLLEQLKTRAPKVPAQPEAPDRSRWMEKTIR